MIFCLYLIICGGGGGGGGVCVDLVKCAGTLVVCPASLMLQWESEVKLKFETGTMKVLIYHGPSRTRDPRMYEQIPLFLNICLVFPVQ